MSSSSFVPFGANKGDGLRLTEALDIAADKVWRMNHGGLSWPEGAGNQTPPNRVILRQPEAQRGEAPAASPVSDAAGHVATAAFEQGPVEPQPQVLAVETSTHLG